MNRRLVSRGDDGGYEKIDAIALLRTEAAVADSVGLRDRRIELSFDADHVAGPVALRFGDFVGRRGAQVGDVRIFVRLVDDAAHDVRVHDEAAQSHRVLDSDRAPAVMLGQHVVAAKSATLAHIQFVRPAVGFRELIFWQAKLAHALAEFRRDAGSLARK